MTCSTSRTPFLRSRCGHTAVAALALLLATGCSNDFRPATFETPSSGGGANGSGRGVQIEPLNTPRVSYDSGTGKTTIVVQFIARDNARAPLTPGDVGVEMLIDGAALDNESILQEDAEELSSSVHLGLVLDTSYSMLQHTPAAFHPMLEAARNALVTGRDLYGPRPGAFTWTLAWFDEMIYTPGDAWAENDILSIPEPPQGTATKLFAAVHSQAGRMLADFDTIANGPNDHHVLVVFSDGADNYSWFDNSTTSSQGQTTNGSPFDATGYPTITRSDAETAIASHPHLTTHVIGLGSQVRDDDLTALADAGEGRYFKNLDSNEVDTLFEQVVQEFATIQDRGATIPLPPGEYTFTLRVREAGGGGADTMSFTLRAGDEDAGVIEIL